nr:hypothetical protein [Candidatus Njordarchaeota archaeon]
MGNIGSALGPFALYALGVDTPDFQAAVLSLLVIGLIIAFASLFIHETYKEAK